MKPGLLLFTSILLLFNSNSFAEEANNLPPLPVDSTIETQEDASASPSFWQKTKSFFGLGDEEEKKVVPEKLEENDKPDFDANEEDDDLKIPSGFEEDIDVNTSKITDLVESISEVDDENSIPKEIKSDTVDTPTETNSQIVNEYPEKEEELKLPEGFEELDNDKSKPKNPNSDTKLPTPDVVNEEKLDSSENSDIEANKDNEKEDQTTPDLGVPENTTNTTQDLATEKSSQVLPTPEYALQTADTEEPKEQLDKIIGVFKKNKSAPNSLPKIEEEDYAKNNQGATLKKESVELDADQLRFINNEIQVLILPNDDVVLGRLTKQAKFIEMPLNQYIKKFWDNYNRIKREPQRQTIENYIDEYDENFYEDNYI